VLAADLEAPNSRFGSLRLSWRRENDSRFWRSIRAEPRHHDCHIINHFGDGLLWMVTKHESLLNLARLPFFSQRFWRDRAVRLSEAIEIAEVATVISMIF